MPLIKQSSYHFCVPLLDGHVQTIWGSKCRTTAPVDYRRERLELSDGDFVELDWAPVGSKTLVVIGHGLEGHSRRSYMQGMARACNRRGWDAVAFNYRGCGGSPNRKPGWYHSGLTADLDEVMRHCAARGHAALYLIGFSIGGNLVLKYLGERQWSFPAALKGAAAVSPPCDLAASAQALARRSNRLYMNYFLRQFHEKIRAKMAHMPGVISDVDFESIRTFKQFDDRYTAPLNGFADAEDYWRRCGSLRFLDAIRTPVLVVCARNDPMVTDESLPINAARSSPVLHCEITRGGGHVGWFDPGARGECWHEQRICSFFAGMQ
jgi:predicted alpha/beta-fold hydrolase